MNDLKIAFFISSIINVKNTKGTGFGSNDLRSIFSPEERLRQTQVTLANLKLLFPYADLFLFELGEKSNELNKHLPHVENLKIIYADDLDKLTADLCRKIPSKGLCETLATLLFLDNYGTQLGKYDFLIKLSGRYFYTKIDNQYLIKENTDKYLCKVIQKFDWNDWWQYPSQFKESNKINWAPSQTYIVGKQRLTDFYNSLIEIKNFYQSDLELAKIFDFECAYYYFMLKNKPYIEIPWTVGGWSGHFGTYSDY